jgi:hypothetical protein
MIVTEDKARTLWCPMARLIIDSDGSYNRSETGEPDHPRLFVPPSSRCLASGCAMWRQHDETKGYCGLAGPPRGVVDDR